VKKTPDNPILTVVKSAQPVNNTGEADKWADRRIGDYCISHSCIFFMRKGRDNKEGKINEIPTPLTHNFVALIAEQINLDDGLKQEAAFLVEGRQKNGQPLPTLTIPATQYQAMQWPLRNYGGRGIVEADQATPRRLANGILILSGDIPITTVYQHTGWRHINDQWFYLSGSGAIGADGLNAIPVLNWAKVTCSVTYFPSPPSALDRWPLHCLACCISRQKIRLLVCRCFAAWFGLCWASVYPLTLRCFWLGNQAHKSRNARLWRCPVLVTSTPGDSRPILPN